MKKPKHPDRWGRMVKETFSGLANSKHDILLMPDAMAAALLRREHRAIVRMVRGEKVSGETGTEGDIAYNQAIDDILAKLKARGQ